MKPKTARRFFERNSFTIVRDKVVSQVAIFSYFNRKKYKKYLVALRQDQRNPASGRSNQRALAMLR